MHLRYTLRYWYIVVITVDMDGRIQFETEAPPPREVSETPKERRERVRAERMAQADAEMLANREKCACGLQRESVR